MKKVYVSHRIAGTTEEAIRVLEKIGALEAARLGYSEHQIVFPRKITPWCVGGPEIYNGECLIPGRRIPGDDHTVPCYLRADFEELIRCESIIMTPGWFDSVGCMAELNVAVHAGINVHFT